MREKKLLSLICKECLKINKNIKPTYYKAGKWMETIHKRRNQMANKHIKKSYFY